MVGDLNHLLDIIKSNISTVDLSQYIFVEPAFLL